MVGDDATVVVRARAVRGWQRTVRIEDGVVIKEYRRLRVFADVRRPWAREHQALTRLRRCGVAAPESFGYARVGLALVRARRGFIDGRSVDALTGEDRGRVARHFAEIHGALVTMGDAALDNLMVLPDGHCMCIDYGRARVFLFRSPLFFMYVGKELARIRRRMFGRDVAAWEQFAARYREAARHPAWAWPIIARSEDWWRRRWLKRWGD